MPVRLKEMEKVKRMNKRIAILQSNYIPWKGYFDMINMVDVFVILDEVQFTKNDWRNRNQIKTPNGCQWLTIPVVQKKLDQSIRDTRVADSRWSIKHWKTIQQNYAKSPCFSEYKDELGALYAELGNEKFISDVNRKMITYINQRLGIQTEIIDSTSIEKSDDKNQRLLDMCQYLGAKTYISGPAAQGYLQEELFEQQGISVEWMDYSGYPEYQQLFPPFEHAVSILDMLFNVGDQTMKYMKAGCQ